MGYRLSRWALNVEHPCLTPRTRQVLAAICLIAHDEDGQFWMRWQKFLEKNLPDMSYGAYRNHLSSLVRNELLIKTAHGGGSTAQGHGTGNQYHVNSPVVQNPYPDRGVLPDIVKSPETAQPQPDVDEQTLVDANAVHRRVDELLVKGITSEQILGVLEFVELASHGIYVLVPPGQVSSGRGW